MNGPRVARPAVLRLRAELRDLVEVVLLPGLAAVLPWPLCFRLFSKLAHQPWLYRDAAERSLTHAARMGWVRDVVAWSAARRLVTLVDHADYYLARTRSDAWMRRHLDVQGSWDLSTGAQVLCTFHWGAGMWALRSIAAAGLDGHMLVARLDSRQFRHRRIFYRYIQARTAAIASSLRNPTLDPLKDLRGLLAVLGSGGQIVAAIDVPSDQVSASTSVRIAGGIARIPRGLLKTAVERKLPVSVFVTGIDLDTGRRFLRIHPLGVHQEVDSLVEKVFSILDQAIRENPAAWHFWSEAERFFDNPVFVQPEMQADDNQA
jgi:phosphatidylinositol dimannoside acyltransferase